MNVSASAVEDAPSRWPLEVPKPILDSVIRYLIDDTNRHFSADLKNISLVNSNFRHKTLVAMQLMTKIILKTPEQLTVALETISTDSYPLIK
jgi:hypothetical protein